MPVPEPLVLPERALTIAGLVAVEFEAHREHVRRQARREFAAELAVAFRDARPEGDDALVRGVGRGIEVCVLLAEILADLPVPDGSGSFRNGTEQSGTVPNETERFRTAADG